jgi:hypothetical protein
MKHPLNKAERRRSAEAKALQHLHQRRINGKKRKIQVDLKEEETKNELHQIRNDYHLDGFSEAVN